MSDLRIPDTYRALVITAHLQQGAVLDHHYGLALDGVLAAVARRLSAAPGTPGSLIDGGLDNDQPTDWELPLAQCHTIDDWHWAIGHGTPTDLHGNPLPRTAPDTHRISSHLDDNRLPHTLARIPAEASPRRGRFRNRVRPVLVTPAHSIRWNAIGDAGALISLLANVTALGGRRGIGEGHVLEWDVDTVTTADPFLHVHVSHDTLSRPMPADCATRTGLPSQPITAGIRPPYFHPARQRQLRKT